MAKSLVSSESLMSEEYFLITLKYWCRKQKDNIDLTRGKTIKEVTFSAQFYFHFDKSHHAKHSYPFRIL